MTTKKRLITAISSILAISCLTTSVSAYSSASQGHEYDLTINGTGVTVVCFHCNGGFYTCDVGVTDFGSGSGNLNADCYSGIHSYTKTFYGANTETMMYLTSPISGYWNIDFQNSKMTKTRTGVDVKWEFG